MDNRFRAEKVDKERINDKNLIERIFKNSRKGHFDYLDSVSIVKNKSFICLQLMLHLLIWFSIAVVIMVIGYPMGFLAIIYSIIHILIVYKKFNKINRLVNEENKKTEINKLKQQLTKEWDELFIIMKEIPIEQDRIDYTRKKFKLKINECKSETDYTKILKEIKDDINKYNNVSGKKTKKKSNFDQEYADNIAASYEALDLPQGATYDEVKKKYRILIKIYHPDSNSNTPEEEEEIRKINKAYNILKEYLKGNK